MSLSRLGFLGATRAGDVTPRAGAQSAQRPSPMLLLNPADDKAFARASRSAIDAGATNPGLLESILRHQYPNVVVRERELVGELIAIWYVYRDGHWVRANRARRPDG